MGKDLQQLSGRGWWLFINHKVQRDGGSGGGGGHVLLRAQ